MTTLQKRSVLLEYIPMAITALTILVSAIILNQMVIKVIPLLFSIVISLLSARANRICFILGAINSIIYIVGYFMEGVYGTMLSTAFGAVMQVLAYIQWKKNAYGKSTVFRRFTLKQRYLFSGVLVVFWVVATVVLWKLGGAVSVSIIDGLVLILGFVVPILNIWGFIESPALNCLCFFVQIPLWAIIIFTDSRLENITYLISSVYTFYMVIRTFIRWYQLYKEQKLKDNII